MLQVSGLWAPSVPVSQEKTAVLSPMGDSNSSQSGEPTTKGARIVALVNANSRGVCRDYNNGMCNGGEGACNLPIPAAAAAGKTQPCL